MSETPQQVEPGSAAAVAEAPPPAPVLHVAPSPHVYDTALTTRRMMIDVLIALIPVVLVSLYVFRLYAVKHVALCLLACLLAELAFSTLRGAAHVVLLVLAAAWLAGLWLVHRFAPDLGAWAGVARQGVVFGGLGVMLAAGLLLAVRGGRKLTILDGSAAVTGLILALSLPGAAPWYVSVIGSFVAIGIGKVLFGGLGQNIFNPAMVGRAFVLLAFAGAVGASGYRLPPREAVASRPAGLMELTRSDAITRPTPLTVGKKIAKKLSAGEALAPDERMPRLADLLLGNTNGSLGETSALACLVGGLYLLIRRTASWQIPAGVLGAVVVIGGLMHLFGDPTFTLPHHLLGGALLFGAFFIATDPVSSPITPKGKLIFGAGIGALVMLIRTLSNYPEGVMFAVLLMNAVVPLINRWTIPTPIGGPVPRKE